MTTVMIKKPCIMCKSKGFEEICSCRRIDRQDIWECARGVCDGTKSDAECDYCDGRGFIGKEALLFEGSNELLGVDALKLYEAIKHGDDEHKVWLKEAILAYFRNEPVPEPRGKGNKEVKIDILENKIELLEEQIECLNIWLNYNNVPKSHDDHIITLPYDRCHKNGDAYIQKSIWWLLVYGCHKHSKQRNSYEPWPRLL
jgi:hypothetical protein